MKFVKTLALTVSAFFLSPTLALAASQAAPAATEAAQEGAHGPHLALLFLAIAGILVAAKFLHLIEKIKLPPVVGELVAGIVLGNLALVGFPFFREIQQDQIIAFLAELGVIILLFQIGLESNVGQLIKVGRVSLFVALIGAFVPFLLGTYIVGPLLLPNQSLYTYLFLGASFAATSVGIPARILREMGYMKSRAGQIFMGATVIDDILGLVLLAIISSLVTEGSVTAVSVFFILAKAFLFLILSVLIGQLLAPYISRAFSFINTGMGTKFTLAISFGLLFAAFAELIGLEPIVGAFAAGLVLDPVHFHRFREPHIIEELKEKLGDLNSGAKEKLDKVLQHHAERSVEDIIEPLALFFVPIFFVTTGMSVNLATLTDPTTIILALVLAIVAILGKVVAGLPIKGKDRWTVGLAMVPRGEVGLIFAAIGQSLGVISPQVFSVIILTVLITTVVGPTLLTRRLYQLKEAA